jgi:hypothetical protein
MESSLNPIYSAALLVILFGIEHALERLVRFKDIILPRLARRDVLSEGGNIGLCTAGSSIR